MDGSIGERPAGQEMESMNYLNPLWINVRMKQKENQVKKRLLKLNLKITLKVVLERLKVRQFQPLQFFVTVNKNNKRNKIKHCLKNLNLKCKKNQINNLKHNLNNSPNLNSHPNNHLSSPRILLKFPQRKYQISIKQFLLTPQNPLFNNRAAKLINQKKTSIP